MFEILQASDGFYAQNFLQNKCIPNLTLSYPMQIGSEIMSRGSSLGARSNSALLTDDKHTSFNYGKG
jgi:hypothetical protein